MIKLDLDNNAHTLLLQEMWGNMENAGDIEAGFLSDSHIITRFFEIFRPPTQTFIGLDDTGIYTAFWFSPLFSAMIQGLWIREDRRGNARVFMELVEVLRQVFEHIPVVIGYTKRRDLLEPVRKMGYDISMAIPDLFEGQTGWMIQCHRSRFKYLKKEISRCQEAEVEVAHQDHQEKKI